jgi:peptide chain release factor 1
VAKIHSYSVKTCFVLTLRQEAGGVFDSELLESRPGLIVILFTGKGAKALFQNEAGGHRWQRVPPTEKRGRVHTSTVTVAVLDPEPDKAFVLNEKDVEIKASRGSGPGGQHRNKTESCITAVHLPTKLSVKIDMKSQHQSKEMALKILAVKVKDVKADATRNDREKLRKEQVGSGMRGDKIRTYRSQDDRVTNHRTGQTWKLSKWMKGEW